MTATMNMPRRPEMERGPGELREATVRRRRMIVTGVLFAAGLFSGIYVGYQEAGAAFHGGPGAWSPTVALLLAAVYFLAIVGGSLLLHSAIDEVERQASYKAVSFAGAVYILVYPLWFLLWKGGFVAEPVHWVLFSLFWLSLAAATLFYRFR